MTSIPSMPMPSDIKNPTQPLITNVIIPGGNGYIERCPGLYITKIIFFMQSDEKKIDPIKPEKNRRGINIRQGEFHKVTKSTCSHIIPTHMRTHTHEGKKQPRV